MKFQLFPRLHAQDKGRAAGHAAAARRAEALGFELCELPEWQCCGAVYPQATDEIATQPFLRPRAGRGGRRTDRSW